MGAGACVLITTSLNTDRQSETYTRYPRINDLLDRLGEGQALLRLSI